MWEEEYFLLKKRGLIGERDTPYNPEFIKNGYSKIMLQRYENVLQVCTGKVVLDVGCGLGWGTNIVRNVASKVYGIDYDPETIRYCKERYPHDNVYFEVMDCRKLAFKENSFDVVLLMEVIEHLTMEDGYRCINEIVRVLKPGGSLIGTTYIAPTPHEREIHIKHSDNKYHLHIYTRSEMENLLSKFFRLYEIRGHTTFMGSLPQKSHSPEMSIIANGKRKRRILLTTSAAPSQSPFSTTEKRPPIGIGFLISVLRKAGHEVFFIDNYLQPSDFLETDYLQQNDIEYVGIYANTICYRDTLRMLYKLEYLRQTGKWKGKIIVGGPHTTVAVDTIPDFVDYVVQGEGEHAVLDIIEGKVKERIVRYPPIKNLDELPMPAWDYFVNLPYHWGGDWLPEEPVFTMNTSRGCPFSCKFCSVGSIWGRRYTYFSAKRLVSDIEYLIENYGAKGIYFREDNFTLNRKRVVEFCNLLLERGIKITWACETRVDTLDRELVELMYRAGARAFYFGVESGCQRILDFLKKGIKVEQIRNAFRLCHEFGIKTAASIIVGVPTETESEIAQTIELLKEIRPTVTWFNVFVGIPNSELYRYTLENNLYEFIDDRGLVYLKGHNERVKRFYGNQWNAYIPVNFDNPKISVIMAVYNGSRYIEKAIESILTQTYQDFEFIIINDASTDSTAEILNKFNDPRIRIITNEKNLGLTKSLNRGIELARGKYIARMDADDVSLPHRFERQVEFLEKNPEYALVGSSYYQIDENGNMCSLIKVLTDDQDLRKGLKRQNWFGHGSVMIRRDVLLKVGKYDERFVFAQDYDLWLRIAEQYKVANIEEPLYCWRVTPQCISKEREEEQRYYARLALLEAEKRTSKKKNIPLVSVIIPTYNRPEMLVNALKSVLNQTFKDFEIIVINDGGMDVENIITPLNRDNNITYVRHGKNRGLAAARNTGIKLARGKYIAYLDDDDLYYPDHLETLVKALENSEYKVAYTDAYRAIQIKENGEYKTVEKDIPYSHDFDYDQILVTNFIPIVCFMHERSCLDNVGMFDESLPVLEDWDLWIRISRKYKLLHIKKITAEFTWRKDGGTMTSERQIEFVNTGQIIQKRYRRYTKDKPHILVSQQEAYKRDRERIYNMSDHPLVSVIIPILDDTEQALQCLEGVASNTSYEPYEVIIIARDARALRGHIQGDVKIIQMEEGCGFIRACNIGAKEARGKYIVFLSESLYPTKGWLSELVKTAECNDNVGIAGSKLLYPDNTVWHAGIVLRKGDEPYYIFRGLGADHEAVNSIREFEAVSTSCMLVNRKLFFEIGGFKDKGNSNEDTEFCLRVREKGYRIIYNPSSILYFPDLNNPRDNGERTHVYDNRLLQDKIKEAKNFISEGHIAEAISVFAELLESHPHLNELYAILCDLYIKIGWECIPKEWIKRAVKYDRSFIQTFNDLANRLFEEEKFIEYHKILSAVSEAEKERGCNISLKDHDNISV